MAKCFECKKELTQFERSFNAMCVNNMIMWCRDCLVKSDHKFVVSSAEFKELLTDE